MQKPPEKLFRGPLGNSPQPVHTEARSTMDDRFVTTSGITISPYASF